MKKLIHQLNFPLLEKLHCPHELYPLIKYLNTPAKIQDYLEKKLTYNHGDTVNAFPRVIHEKKADCFEGGIGFAYPLLSLWGYRPLVVMLHGDHRRDVDHTLIIYKEQNKIGAIAKSSFPTLTDRKSIYPTLHDLIDTYYPYYVSDFPEYMGELTLIGYSDPIDLIAKFGYEWFFLKEKDALKHLYNHFTDRVMCTNYITKKRFLYPPEDKLF